MEVATILNLPAFDALELYSFGFAWPPVLYMMYCGIDGSRGYDGDDGIHQGIREVP